LIHFYKRYWLDTGFGWVLGSTSDVV